MRYHKFTADAAQVYQIDPLLLKEYRNRWYLIAFREERNKVQSFGLERIRSLELTEESYSPPENFDPEHYFSKSIGITAFDAQPVKVKFEASQISAPYIKPQPVHQSQLILGEKDGWTTFEIEVLVTEELIMYFLSLGDHVRVIGPKSLREEISGRIRKSLSLYETQ